jgi:hypothetical protein
MTPLEFMRAVRVVPAVMRAIRGRRIACAWPGSSLSIPIAGCPLKRGAGSDRRLSGIPRYAILSRRHPE